MKYLRLPNLFDVAISVIVATAPSWIGGFVSAQLPLWSIAAAIVVGFGVYFLLAIVRRRRNERHNRDEERHREIIKSIDRLTEALSSTRGRPR